MKLKCDCCHIEREFDDLEAAFWAGWDAPPHFTGYICCDLCPAVCIVMGVSHAIAHARWAENGRPSEFSVEECGPDESTSLLRRTRFAKPH
jgi:hypothetical protein